MILAIVRITTKSVKQRGFPQIMGSGQAGCCKPKSCLGHEIYQSLGDQNTFVVLVRWADQATLEKSTHCRVLNGNLKRRCRGAEIERHTVIDTTREDLTKTTKVRKGNGCGRTRAPGTISPMSPEGPGRKAPDRLWKSGSVLEEQHRSELSNGGSAGEAVSVRAVEDYVRAHLDQDLNVSDLAAAAGVSSRTLFRSFRGCRGRTPMKLLQTARLEQVRRDLLTGRPGETVTRVATRWGFGHLGRFAAYYRQHHGENPSETLRQSRERSSSGKYDGIRDPDPRSQIVN